jgi:hypothetical protein
MRKADLLLYLAERTFIQIFGSEVSEQAKFRINIAAI